MCMTGLIHFSVVDHFASIFMKHSVKHCVIRLTQLLHSMIYRWALFLHHQRRWLQCSQIEDSEERRKGKRIKKTLHITHVHQSLQNDANLKTMNRFDCVRLIYSSYLMYFVFPLTFSATSKNGNCLTCLSVTKMTLLRLKAWRHAIPNSLSESRPYCRTSDNKWYQTKHFKGNNRHICTISC